MPKNTDFLPLLTRRRALAGGAVLAVAAAAWSSVLLPWTLDPTDASLTLEGVETDVARRYGVAEINAQQLTLAMAEKRVVVFDVRAAEEYAMGHLPGAILVSPEESVEGFLRAHKDILGALPVVFSCSVGVRSGVLARRLMASIAPHAQGGVFNLRGGLFRWVAQGRALVAEGGPGALHPYDASWKQLLDRTLSAR